MLRRLVAVRRALVPPALGVRISLARVARGEPLGHAGYNSGCHSVAREYIDRFVAAHAADVRGRVLEIGDRSYTTRHADNVESSDVVHLLPDHGATIVCDLNDSAALDGRSFDTVICTQTLQLNYEPRAVLETLAHALVPGGTLIASMSGICQLSRYDMDRWGEYWRFTNLSAARLFHDVFGPQASVTVTTYGNVLTACAHLAGLAAREVPSVMYDDHDPDYELVIGVRAVKPLVIGAGPRP